MRTAYLVVVAALVAAPAAAQSIVGRYALTTPEGNKVSLVIEANGPGKVKGSLSGNGLSFVLDGTLEDGDLSGTLKGSTGSALIEASRQGSQLAVMLVEIASDGTPIMNSARQLAFAVDNSPPTRGAAPGASAGAAQQGRGTQRAPAADATSPRDQQLRQLLVSSAWCTMSFSGGSTYTGGSYGRTTTKRAVFTADGIVRQSTNSENSNSGAPGSVYSNSDNVETYRWKVENGAIVISADGVQWQPLRTEVYANSNGYPIVKADGVEYNQCR